MNQLVYLNKNVISLPTESKKNHPRLVRNRINEPENESAVIDKSLDEPTMPFAVSAEDLRDVIQFFKKSPAGIKLTKDFQLAHKRVFEEKKIRAYEILGVIARNDQTIKLTARGWQFLKILQPEICIFRHLLQTYFPYVEGLKWIFESKKELVTVEDIAAFWEREKIPDFKGEKNVYREAGVSFFHLCQAADLGTMTLGKRGHVTRIMLNRSELAFFLKSKIQTSDDSSLSITEQGSGSFLPQLQSADDYLEQSLMKEKFSVLVSINQDSVLANQIKTAFDLGGVECVIVERGETETTPLDKNFKQAMKKCQAGCIVIGKSDLSPAADKSHRLKDNLLYELGASYLCFEENLVLLSPPGLKLPESLQAVTNFEVNGDGLTWEIGSELVKNIKTKIQKFEKLLS